MTAVTFGLLQLLVARAAVYSDPFKIILAFLMLFPLGFFMGMPFPFGLHALKQEKKGIAVALMWGLNGTLSIVGSVLAAVISMKLGFSYTLGLGALVYLALFILVPIQKDRLEVMS